MKLLFVRFSSMGDVLLTTGIIRQVKASLPEAEISVLSSDDFADIYKQLDFVDGTYTVSRKFSKQELKRFLQTLPSFDYIFDLHASLRSRYACRILRGKLSRYKKLSLCRRLYAAFGICGGRLKKHVAQRYAEAVFPALNLPVPSLEELRPFLAEKTPPLPGKTVLHPFASRFTKIWPFFPELAEALAAKGKDVYIIGVGDFPDIPNVKRVHAGTLAELFSFLADAELLISGDSGPMHAGIALQVPLVAIFGGTVRQYGFYPDFEACTVLETDGLSCRPCGVHGKNHCPEKHFRCMREITVEAVLMRTGL